jgi:hypothetical protein
VFELLKGHLCLGVYAMAMIDLDQDIRGSQLTDPVPRPFQGALCLYVHSSHYFRPRSWSPKQGGGL